MKKKNSKSAIKVKPKALKVPTTVQQSLPYRRVYPDAGIIETDDGVFCHAYKMQDLNFGAVAESEQVELYLRFCNLLNSFDANQKFQIVINNHAYDKKEFEKNVLMPYKNDGFDGLREEENAMLREKLEQGRSNLTSDRYLIVSVEAESAAAAAVQFARYDTSIVNLVSKIGKADCEPLSSTEMLHILYDIYNRGAEDDFGAKTRVLDDGQKVFDFDSLHRMGLTTKDAIGPDSMEWKGSHFRFGEKNYGRVEYLAHIPSQLSTNFYTELYSLDFSMLCSVQYQSVPQEEALKRTKNHLTNVNSNVVDAQKRAAKAGYSGDLISEDLKLNAREANEMLNDLQVRNQKLFEISLTIVHFADSVEELDEQTDTIQTVARKHLAGIQSLTFQQENGFNSSLPLCNNNLALHRTLTTETAAVFFPFNCQELNMRNGFYYGMNAVSHNLVMADRRSLQNGNGWILATPGGGKSFAAKAEIMNVVLQTTDDIIILDPDREYGLMAYTLNQLSTTGRVARVERFQLGDKDNYINPMDLPPYTDDEDNDPLANQLPFLLGLCQSIYSDRYPLPQGCQSLVDRAMRLCYQPYMEGYIAGHPDPRLVPTLKDLQQQLTAFHEPAARELALSMEIYTQGSLDLFSHQTTIHDVDAHCRMTVYDIKDLGNSLKPLAMRVLTNAIWNKLVQNRVKGRNTYIVFDEIYLLFKDEYSAEFLKTLWKRSRKYGGIITGITQNVEDLLTNDTCRSMLSNAEFLEMLKQAPLDRSSLATLLNLSDTQLSYITGSEAGQGLLSVGKNLVPFDNTYPKNTQLYKLMNTNLKDMTKEDLERLEEANRAN